MTRLRPCTAQLLLHLCHLQPGEVLLDPCVGIGTLALEASNGVVALGGDLVLTKAEGLGPVAADCAVISRRMQQTLTSSDSSSITGSRAFADLTAWDASYLPIRAQSVDAIVSDLPFGQRCLTSSRLHNLLPLMASEWARVLHPRGRMVLLCGSYAVLLQALVKANEERARQLDANEESNDTVWDFPCTALFPVNIGGNLAWVLQIARGTAPWSPIANQRQRVRKLSANRSRIAHLDKNDKAGKQKRLQA